MKDPNIYLVTAKLIPKAGYKPIFRRGVCMAFSEEKAKNYVMSKLKETSDLIERVEITKIIKTHSQFVLNSEIK